MGWVTKKKKTWELKHLLWIIISIVMFLPVPIHIHPIVMLSQAKKSKVRSWYMLGIFLLIFELMLFGSFVYFFGAMSQGMLLTLGGSVVSYIVGNGLLLNQARPYLQRLELAELRPLQWISSIGSQKRLEMQPMSLNTPQIFVSRLLHWRKEINNVRIHEDIDKIIGLFQFMEKKDKKEAEKFLVRHSTIVNVLMKYDEIENSKLKNEVTVQSQNELAVVINKAAIAIEQEVTNQFKTGILEVSAETDAYLESLRNRNLLNE